MFCVTVLVWALDLYVFTYCLSHFATATFISEVYCLYIGSEQGAHVFMAPRLVVW